MRTEIRLLSKALFGLQNVSQAYEAELGKTRNPLFSRRVLGAIGLTFFTIVGIYTDVHLDPAKITNITDAVYTIANSVGVIWSSVLIIVGILKAGP